MAGSGLISADVIDTVQLGILGSAFSTLYAVGRLVNGVASDKAPPWLMLTSGLVLVGIANIFIGFFPPFTGILLLW